MIEKKHKRAGRGVQLRIEFFGWLHLTDVGLAERLPVWILHRFRGNGEIGAENWPI